MYAKYFKRIIDVILSFCTIIVLSPILLLLIMLGMFFMRGNPFFLQKRIGKDENIFVLIKFRTMDNRCDKNGNLLPDEVRLNRYGCFLRKTSLDELPELFNILKGDMSIVGPRPLLVKYLPYYSDTQRHRHDIRPGLTGYAQAHGRNNLNWDDRMEKDIWYLNNISFKNDALIIIDTIKQVIRREGINQEGNATMEDFIEYVIRRSAK